MCIFGRKSSPPQVIQGPPAPTESNADADAARTKAGYDRMRAAKAGGRQSTVQNLGGGAGLKDDNSTIFNTTLRS